MPCYVALLRSINVGGKSMVPMADLRELFEAEGFPGAKTLLQSGNVVFESKTAKAPALETKLEKVAAKRFGRVIDFLIRDEAEWKKIIAKNPFPDEAASDPSHLVVLCTKSAPTAGVLAALKSAIVGREVFRPGERCLYLYYPDGIGTSKLTNAIIDRKLGMTSTARNWNTVQKIAALL